MNLQMHIQRTVESVRKLRKNDKEAGIERVVVKKVKRVEDHYDDCGDCLDSIVKDVNTYGIFDGSDDSEEEFTENSIYHNIGLHMLWGGEEPVQFSRIQSIHLGNPHEMTTLLIHFESVVSAAAVPIMPNITAAMIVKCNFIIPPLF